MSNLRTAAAELLHLHMCEQEGIASAMPTKDQWLKAVDDLSKALSEPQKETPTVSSSPSNIFQLLLAMEYGFRQHEKGNNIDMAMSNFKKLL